jgi:hypothetical protein
MTLPPASDLLLSRNREAILAEILASRAAYTPEWLPAAGAAGHGLADITAGFLELLQERLAHVPEHRQAVLLDLLGASMIPAQGARTHVLLTAVPGTRGARVPAGTRIGAIVPGRSDPVVFETQDSVAISPATVVEVHSVHAAADSEEEHSADVLARRPFTIFGNPARVVRELYIGHDKLLAFDGRAVVELEVGIGDSAGLMLPMAWSWWDGIQWRAFTQTVASPLLAGDDDSVDGTAGLTRSGTTRLVAPVATAKPFELNGRKTFWIRGSLQVPLRPDAADRLPTITRLRLAAVNERRRLRVQRSAGIAGFAMLSWPEGPSDPMLLHVRDATTAGGTDLPITVNGAAVLGALDGHKVRLGVSLAASRAPAATPAPVGSLSRIRLDADADLTETIVVDSGDQIDLAVARGLALDKGVADRSAVDLSKTFAPLGPAPVQGTAFHFACSAATRRSGTKVTLLIERPQTAAEEADQNSDLQRDAATAANDELNRIIAVLKGVDVTGALQAALAELDAALPELRGKALVNAAGQPVLSADAWFKQLRAPIVAGLTLARKWINVGMVAAGAAIPAVLPGVQAAALGAAVAHFDEVKKAIDKLEDPLPKGVPNDLLAMEPTAYIILVKKKLATARAHVDRALKAVTACITDLEKLDPAALAVERARSETTQLTPPELAWEYHDGTRWRDLGVDGDARVLALQASGPVHFQVPDDIAAVDLDGDVREWLRARLARGSYSHLSLVSWSDEHSVNFMPVVEPRAPMVDRVEVFYSHRSEATDASAVISHDTHEWHDLTASVAWPARGAVPFAVLPESAPTLYLGLDGELPADRIGLWVQPVDQSPWAPAHRPVWEGWDGTAWVRLATDDGTDGWRRAGAVGLLWPGTSGAPGVTVSGALGSAITLLGRGAAARFSPGDRLMLLDVQGQEPIVVATAAGETVTTRTPLTRAYAGAQLVTAPPARFGVPRTWVRAVFDPFQQPPTIQLAGLAAHAVEVAQLETLHDEQLGSGDGSPGQVLIARRYPFAGEVELEVRELDGDRADLDKDVLTRTLSANGFDLESVRLVRDARTDRVREVWVPWTAVQSLGSAGPDDRAFVPDRARGRIIFGGAGHGRPLPAGRDNARLRDYRVTDGAVGNVGAGRIDALLSAAAVGEIHNPVAATGGADVEPFQVALHRSAGLLRHRRLALTEADVAAVALEASPAVVRARALGAVDAFGRSQPGTVQVVVVPRDGTEHPQPSAALLATVRAAVVAASPAVAASRVVVLGPCYRPVGVSVTVIPLVAQVAGAARERVLATLQEFLHPLRGGPDGIGWGFGVAAHLSDLARVLEAVPGVDAVADLSLSLDGVPVGDSATVGPDQIICAGPLAVHLGGD